MRILSPWYVFIFCPYINRNARILVLQPLFTASLDRGDDSGFYTFGVIDAAGAGVSESEYVRSHIYSHTTFQLGNKVSNTQTWTTVKGSGCLHRLARLSMARPLLCQATLPLQTRRSFLYFMFFIRRLHNPPVVPPLHSFPIRSSQPSMMPSPGR